MCPADQYIYSSLRLIICLTYNNYFTFTDKAYVDFTNLWRDTMTFKWSWDLIFSVPKFFLFEGPFLGKELAKLMLWFIPFVLMVFPPRFSVSRCVPRTVSDATRVGGGGV